MVQGTKSVSLTLTYNSDANANLIGGERTGQAYLQRIGLIADADLEQLVGWRGAKFHASVHAINGLGLSSEAVGNLLTVSGIEAEPALRLFNLWIEQSFSHRGSLRVGQFTAGQEFMLSTTASLFVNSTFGWPGSFATDLPSGGPAYPLAAPGIRLTAQASDGTAARAAIFSGDPAGRGFGDPQRRDVHGFNAFSLKGPPFVIGEVSKSFGSGSPRLTLTAGGWVHFGRFEDLDGRGRHDGNYSAYGIVDVRLWAAKGRSLSGFVRASASPSDRNRVDVYADAGVALTGPLRQRPGDIAGIAVGFARLSPDLRSALRRQGAIPAKIPHLEAVVELSYRFMVSKSAYFQPNVQWIINPSAWAVTGDTDANPPPGSAFVVGLRSSLVL